MFLEIYFKKCFTSSAYIFYVVFSSVFQFHLSSDHCQSNISLEYYIYESTCNEKIRYNFLKTNNFLPAIYTAIWHTENTKIKGSNLPTYYIHLVKLFPLNIKVNKDIQEIKAERSCCQQTELPARLLKAVI